MTAHAFIDRIRTAELTARTGRVLRILPTYVEADGPNLSMGDLCLLETRGDQASPVLAEVAGVHPESIVLAPLEHGAQTFSGARVTAREGADTVPVGDAFLGRAVDPMGRPIDGLGEIAAEARATLDGDATAPLDRTSPIAPLTTGVRAIDGLLTLGRGQRVGIFAAAGVGKTSLMTQLATQVEADRAVICLVGERGREVEALWSNGLSPRAKARSVMVAATSDQTAAMRVRAGSYALALAEHWRAQGHNVLLLLDSVTRLAMAMREVGLAAGEPPTTRAYTPGVFARIPRLVERCGALKSGGSITAVMTVLAETDDLDDPVSEMMKSLLDGHILLSRSLAEKGHFPAIDAPRSVSRLAPGLVDARHRAAASKAIELLSTYEASRTLIETGVYVAGANAEIDRALAVRPALGAYLRQGQQEQAAFAETASTLARIVGEA